MERLQQELQQKDERIEELERELSRLKGETSFSLPQTRVKPVSEDFGYADMMRLSTSRGRSHGFAERMPHYDDVFDGPRDRMEAVSIPPSGISPSNMSAGSSLWSPMSLSSALSEDEMNMIVSRSISKPSPIYTGHRKSGACSPKCQTGFNTPPQPTFYPMTPPVDYSAAGTPDTALSPAVASPFVAPQTPTIPGATPPAAAPPAAAPPAAAPPAAAPPAAAPPAAAPPAAPPPAAAPPATAPPAAAPPAAAPPAAAPPAAAPPAAAPPAAAPPAAAPPAATPPGAAPPPAAIPPAATSPNVTSPPPGLLAPPPLALLAAPKPRKAKVTPKKRMKQLYWKRILLPPQQQEGSEEKETIWSKMTDLSDFDGGEFESYFCQKQSKMKKKQKQKGDEKAKQGPTRVLTDKRTNQVAIMLSGMPEIEDLKEAIITMDNNRVRVSQVDQLHRSLPTRDELELISTAAGHAQEWDKPERLFLMLNSIPDVDTRLASWRFERKFDDACLEIQRPLRTITWACQELLESKTLFSILELVLHCGNYMNGGTSKGQADGFDISILPKLRHTKNVTNSGTLLHWLSTIALKTIPKAPQLLGELKNISVAANIVSLEEASSSLKMINAEFKKIEADVSSTSPASDSDVFAENLRQFVSQGKDRLQSLKDMDEEAHKCFVKATNYLSVKYSSNESVEFFKFLATFSQDFADIAAQELKSTKTKVKKSHFSFKKKHSQIKGKSPVASRKWKRPKKRSTKATDFNLPM